jgi:hypothetical protein
LSERGLKGGLKEYERLKIYDNFVFNYDCPAFNGLPSYIGKDSTGPKICQQKKIK